MTIIEWDWDNFDAIETAMAFRCVNKMFLRLFDGDNGEQGGFVNFWYRYVARLGCIVKVWDESIQDLDYYGRPLHFHRGISSLKNKLKNKIIFLQKMKLTSPNQLIDDLKADADAASLLQKCEELM